MYLFDDLFIQYFISIFCLGGTRTKLFPWLIYMESRHRAAGTSFTHTQQMIQIILFDLQIA